MKTLLLAVFLLGTALQFCKAETPQIACSTPKCPPNCRLDANADPCPACVCDEEHATRIKRNSYGIQCTMPKCDEPGCSIDYSTTPCPSCKCNNDRTKRQIQCSPPKCDEPGCTMDYSTSPCPSCKCDEENGKAFS
ncbi:hypothetical protein AVEN_157923-1 [Araneus ventricosus]|uniref:Antistasin-like domain-containing protein n=1 Tax=Araneus ventricosus TaxID=182803 RepID=A0A4Y2H9A0_ARAVE|nr:hypothetical protein AVEN_157923-1 [Araneus ventricosus]